MSTFVASLIGSPANVADLGSLLAGTPANGSSLLLLPADDGSFVFCGLEWPIVFRYDNSLDKKALEGERIYAITTMGPGLRTHTMSQKLVGVKPMPQVGFSRTYAYPIGALSRDELFVGLISRGFGKKSSTGDLQRVFGISLVRFSNRDQLPNVDFVFPRDDYGWYEIVAWDIRADTRTAEFLVAHSLGNRKGVTTLEAYRFRGGFFLPLPINDSSFARLSKLKLQGSSIPPATARIDPYTPPKLAIDWRSGQVAEILRSGDDIRFKNVADSSWRRLKIMGANLITFVRGTLFVSARRSSATKERWETYRISRATARAEAVGKFRIAGVSPAGKFWVIQRSDTAEYVLQQSPSK